MKLSVLRTSKTLVFHRQKINHQGTIYEGRGDGADQMFTQRFKN